MRLNNLTYPFRAIAWRYLKAKIREKFPTVQPLSTQELADWLENGSETSPTLIDVRRPEEFAVSHLPGARSVPDINTALGAGLNPNTPLVAYCSIGYRSARLAAQLQKAGFTQVYNLEGSIFQWFNEGRPVIQNGHSVSEVHPYNRLWGLLLEPQRAKTNFQRPPSS